LFLFCINLYLTRFLSPGHAKIQRWFTSGGLKGRRQEIDLLSLSVSDYTFRQSHPPLQHLQKNLAAFIVRQFSDCLEPEVSHVQAVFLKLKMTF
jgi:hypothetical protein